MTISLSHSWEEYGDGMLHGVPDGKSICYLFPTMKGPRWLNNTICRNISDADMSDCHVPLSFTTGSFGVFFRRFTLKRFENGAKGAAMFEMEFLFSTILNLMINLTYTILALVIGIIGLKIVDKKLLKSIDIEEEIKNGNIATAIFASTILIFVALIVSFGLKG
jgi:hypothetical protein